MTQKKAMTGAERAKRYRDRKRIREGITSRAKQSLQDPKGVFFQIESEQLAEIENILKDSVHGNRSIFLRTAIAHYIKRHSQINDT